MQQRVQAFPSERAVAAFGDELGRVRRRIRQLGLTACLGVDRDQVWVLDGERLVGALRVARSHLQRAAHPMEHVAREVTGLAYACQW